MQIRFEVSSDLSNSDEIQIRCDVIFRNIDVTNQVGKGTCKDMQANGDQQMRRDTGVQNRLEKGFKNRLTRNKLFNSEEKSLVCFGCSRWVGSIRIFVSGKSL